MEVIITRTIIYDIGDFVQVKHQFTGDMFNGAEGVIVGFYNGDAIVKHNMGFEGRIPFSERTEGDYIVIPVDRLQPMEDVYEVN